VQHIGWNAKPVDGLRHFRSSARGFEQYRRTTAFANAVKPWAFGRFPGLGLH